MHLKCAIGAMSLVLLTCTGRAKAERPLRADAIGWVSLIEGDATKIVLRHGKVFYRDIKTNDPVFLDDEIAVRGKNTKVTISFSDKDSVVVSSVASYRVEAPSLFDMVKRYGASLLKVKSDFDMKRHQAQLQPTFPASHKGPDDNEVYALNFIDATEPQYIRAGVPQVLPLSWQGGRASVLLFHENDVIHQTSGLSEKPGKIYFYCPPLKSGQSYSLIAGDGKKKIVLTLIGKSSEQPVTLSQYVGLAAAELQEGKSSILQGFADLYAVKGHYYLTDRILLDEIGDPDQRPE